MGNKLKLIDFSNGIKQTEIQYNFNVLQSEISKERRAVAGPGISYGLDLSLDGFDLNIKEGCLIANDGSEVYIDALTMVIDKPILIEKSELDLTVDSYNRIQLQYTPYAATRNTTSENVTIANSGVVITNAADSTTLSIASIKENHITLNSLAGLSSMSFDVSYSTTYKRRDVIFIDTNYKLQYRQGTTSLSPSVPEVKDDEYLYMLGYLEVDGFGVDANGKIIATVKFVKDFTSVRNVYTDSNNKLYLCGTAFDTLKTIHTTEPSDPEEYEMWYDSYSNELKVWRHTDTAEFTDAITYTSSDPNNAKLFDTNVRYKYGQSQIKVYLNGNELTKGSEFEEGSDLTDLQKEDTTAWSKQFHIIANLAKGDVITYRITRYDGYAEWVAANTKSYIDCQERYIWTPEALSYMAFSFSHDLQHFFFDSKSMRNLLYTPDKNAIEILIDQVPLHSDQFDEITINDAIAGDECAYIKKQLVSYYNYQSDFEDYKIAEDYENIGVGFKLAAPLDKKTSYIEVRITQRVNSNPIAKRFQRSATFISEGNATYNKYVTTDAGTILEEPIFTTSTPFRYQEKQLEVYLNGKRLDRDTDFEEVADDSSEKGCNLYSFKILTAIADKDKVSYKITSTVYSYDNVQALLSGFQDQITTVADSVKSIQTTVDNMNSKIESYTTDIRNNIETLSNIETNLDSRYLAKNVQIGKDNLSSTLYNGIAMNNINATYTITTQYQKIDVTDTCSIYDFVILMNINSNKVLCRDTDYKLTKEDTKTFLYILTADVIVSNHLYLSGIRFNRA